VKQNGELQQILDLAASIEALDSKAMQAARERQEQLTKPAGSLGRLEELAIQLAGISGQARPQIKQKAVIVMAADHGVTAEGVSAYPAEVTPQMVYNFLYGGAAINALARQAGARIAVVDVGVASQLEHPGLISKKIADGTQNMAQGPAMSSEQMVRAIEVGREVFQQQLAQGCDLVATGEMGIGNTTASSALTAVLLHAPVAQITGRGTGIDDRQLQHKIEVIERAIAINRPDEQQPLDVLMKVGGLEIAGLVGVILEAAAQRRAILIDGFISGAAALIAVKLNPRVKDYLIAGHVSVEQGHRVLLEHLGLRPLLNLELRLGEGTGAVLAMSIVESALSVHNEMSTFAEAGVSERAETAEMEER
jgi:nicotinate-nucleotide--dimethylbenzimidazole phosphoribosyltransferase